MPKRVQVAQVAFSISGEFITTHARGLVVSGKWRSALTILMQDCEGMTYEIALAILTGKKSLVGDSNVGITLADADPNDVELQSYLNTVQYQYGSLWEYNGQCYKPWGRVHSFNSEDLYWAAETYAPEWNAKRVWSVPFSVLRGRIQYYSPNIDQYLATLDLHTSKYMTVDDVDRDFVHNEIRGGYIWELASDYPVWITPHKTCGAALAASIEIGRHLRRFDCTEVANAKFDSSKVPEKNFDDVEIPVDDTEEEKRIRYENRIAAREKKEAEQALKRAAAIQRIRDEILAVVGTDDSNWIRIGVRKSLEPFVYEEHPSRYVRVPRVPFLNWVFNRSPWRAIDPTLVPEWKTVSPVGLKMMHDDPVHSDWVIGAGLDPDTFYEDDDLNTASFRVRGEILQEAMQYDIEVFSGSGRVYGKTVILKPGEVLTSKDQIGIIPNGSMEYDAALRSAVKYDTAIIMQVGGKLCHAATVARETGLRLVMWSKAGELKWGERITLNLTDRKIDVSQN